PHAGENEFERFGLAPAGHQLILLLRQVEPGKRIKTGFFISEELLPVPDVEAVAHALFDISTKREPVPRNGKARPNRPFSDPRLSCAQSPLNSCQIPAFPSKTPRNPSRLELSSNKISPQKFRRVVAKVRRRARWLPARPVF